MVPGLVLALLVGAGCVGPGFAVRVEVLPVQTEAGTFRIEYPAREEPGAIMVQVAIEQVSARLMRWGRFQEPVAMRLYPDQRSLEKAARRSGYDWLRAWARYDVVEVQAPDSWQPIRASQQDLNETLLHELTHTLMYQMAADKGGWRQKKIPAWFREGMASYTAEQAYRWPTLEGLAQTLEENPDWDPLLRPEPLYARQMPVAYGAAHHAFTFLVNRYGEDAVRALLAEMSRGPDFPAAFTATIGLPPETFLRDFSRYVRLRGFKGGRLLRPPASPD
jgi:hypothetical protein